MRLFQNLAVYPSYVPRLRKLAKNGGFSSQIEAVISDRYGAVHILDPVLRGQQGTFLSIANDAYSQSLWANEQGIPSHATAEEILLSQIEHHRTEVFYNLDPVRFGASLARRLPGSVRASIAWSAAPTGRADLSGFDLIVCNFSELIKGYRKSGLRAEYFAPAADPVMAEYAKRQERPIDVCFVGSFSRHHKRRSELIASVARLADQFEVAMHLEVSRFTRIAELPIFVRALPKEYVRPDYVRRISRPPVFGRDLYETLSNSKIVVNGAIDMAGNDRGNLRCFEAMGTGSLLLSDAGSYPDGMVDNKTLLTYSSTEEVSKRVKQILGKPIQLAKIAAQGEQMLREIYSKTHQWEQFCGLVDKIDRFKRQ